MKNSPIPYDGISCTCDNCGKTRPINQLSPINTRTFWQRVQPGAPLPAGDCPDCGAFAYLENPLEKAVRRLLDCPDLNLDSLEPETEAAMDAVERILS